MVIHPLRCGLQRPLQPHKQNTQSRPARTITTRIGLIRLHAQQSIIKFQRRIWCLRNCLTTNLTQSLQNEFQPTSKSLLLYAHSKHRQQPVPTQTLSRNLSKVPLQRQTQPHRFLTPPQSHLRILFQVQRQIPLQHPQNLHRPISQKFISLTIRRHCVELGPTGERRPRTLGMSPVWNQKTNSVPQTQTNRFLLPCHQLFNPCR